MEFRVKEFINDKYAKAVNILKDNLKENYHVFYGVRLSEILFPASEYGSEAFFKEFESINSITLPLVIFDTQERKTVMVISLEDMLDLSLLCDEILEFFVISNFADLLKDERLVSLYK
ncbi:DNA distortion polypeptide 3 [Yersinia pestis]|uniref:DNA distortion polypeptide 3 n=1 Tax=Yersinia pestis TaxID=632 RepID=UPI001FD163E8|nr:DNA distortion polypeptide 3 [Yersinia pestis]MBI0194778.1 DNA distortion polypeptide 3 [Yersinia pestis subsp. pestis]